MYHKTSSLYTCFLLVTGTVADPAHSFTWTTESTLRYATPLPSPLHPTTSYAPAFSQASGLLPSNVTYTTYSLNRNATTTATGTSASRYDQAAYASLWAPYTYSSTVPFTTTVSATPVASSELVFPPPLYHPPKSTPGRKLPKDFIWGVAGSAWQIEGGLQSEGRGPSILDSFGAAGMVPGSDSVTTDMNYFLYKQDIARIAALGVPYYSFSISWSRIVPFGVANSPVNTQALNHYDDLINTCLEYGVTPVVTLVHADFPTTVNATSSTLTNDFLFYAKQVMTRYGDRVPIWVTFNEPNLFAQFAGGYTALKEILLAHAALYDWYKTTLHGTGRITMKFANNLAIPLDLNSTAHIAAARRYQDWTLGIMNAPLFLGEQIPSTVLDTPGVNPAVLTPFTKTELSKIHGKIDFYSLDAYTPQLVAPPLGGVDACTADPEHPLYPVCVDVGIYTQADGWAIGQASGDYSHIAPQYVRQQVGYVWQTYAPAAIAVTEFGFNVAGETKYPEDVQRYDLLRSTYYMQYLDELLKARFEDGVNLIGCLAWSVVNNNEFGSFEQAYGLQTVNFTDGKFTRRFKRSFFDYVDWFRTNTEGYRGKAVAF